MKSTLKKIIFRPKCTGGIGGGIGNPVAAPFVDLESDLGVEYARILGNHSGAYGEEVYTGSAYTIGTVLIIRAYNYVVANGVKHFSSSYIEATVTMAATGYVVWYWNGGSPEGTGTRVLRNLNGGGFTHFQDIDSTISLVDQNNGWTAGTTVTPVAANQVVLWEDQTTGNNDVTPFPGEPLWVASQLNGHPGIRFDGVNDGMRKAPLSEAVSSFTAHGVIKLLTDASVQFVLDLGVCYLSVRAEGVDGKWQVQTGSGGALSPAAADKNVPVYFTVIIRASGTGNCEFWVDGVLLASFASANTGTTSELGLGTTEQSGVATGTVEWYRLKEFNSALTNGQRLMLEAESVAKYAL